MPRSSRRLGLAFGLAAAVLAVDQASKAVVRGAADRLPWRLGRGLRIELNYNPGISFSRFAGAGSVVTGFTGRRKLVGVSGVTVEQAGRALRR